MPRRRDEPTTATGRITDERLRGFMNEIDQATEALQSEKQAIKDVVDTAKGVGVHTGALKAALRLSKKSAGEQNDFLMWFQRCCEILGVGHQREMFEEPQSGNVVSISQ